ncbi:uncharacterized protein B0P05DRAFT_24040 [Gilbertella persicaria]|uniref:uncharacterized protein n=1 Tax=Gilbertella persicaria TaxID=101096 RepID=UPI00221EA709|nr:uncharacterized protein B0P05DRAFT_24040 [Gilbertella persicaria]KAI8085816.1 hypothetical protein B0P05DRAFT_24040 [Gilbertella persicaria]
MWRSWVDRINTINKIAEEPQLSKEEQLKQEKQQEHFRDSWQKCTDLNSSDEQRSDIFLLELLPLFCETHEQFGTAFTFSIVPDDRAFLSMLTKEIIAGIRKIPEHQSKSESSQALMDNLRSKSHLYNVIRAIQVVCYGPEAIVMLMIQQRIPSIMIKLFRSFIDLSVDYYRYEKEGMVTIEETGDMMTNILKGFVKRQTVLHRLMTEDTLLTLLRIISAKPTEDQEAYLIWKSRTVDILTSVDMNSEVCQYLYQRHCVELLCRLWRDHTEWSVVDHRELLMTLDILYHQLKGSAKIQYWKLFEEMIEASGYETLCKVLRTGPFDQPMLQLKVSCVHYMLWLMLAIDRNCT